MVNTYEEAIKLFGEEREIEIGFLRLTREGEGDVSRDINIWFNHRLIGWLKPDGYKAECDDVFASKKDAEDKRNMRIQLSTTEARLEEAQKDNEKLKDDLALAQAETASFARQIIDLRREQAQAIATIKDFLFSGTVTTIKKDE